MVAVVMTGEECMAMSGTVGEDVAMAERAEMVLMWG